MAFLRRLLFRLGAGQDGGNEQHISGDGEPTGQTSKASPQVRQQQCLFGKPNLIVSGQIGYRRARGHVLRQSGPRVLRLLVGPVLLIDKVDWLRSGSTWML